MTGPVNISNTTQSTNCNNGAVAVSGGVGIDGNLNVCGTGNFGNLVVNGLSQLNNETVNSLTGGNAVFTNLNVTNATITNETVNSITGGNGAFTT